MEPQSLTEHLMYRLVDVTGLGPAGDLLERLDAAPPAVRRGLRSQDAETVGLAASLPLDLAAALVEIRQEGLGDDGRFDREAADRFMAEQAQKGDEDGDDETDDTTAATRLVADAHRLLGVDEDCEPCRAWAVALAEGRELDADEHGHHTPDSLLDVVAENHPAEVDDWAPQIALRIARSAGDAFLHGAGFNALHEVVAHAEGAPGLSEAGRQQAHALQHVGMARTAQVGEVHALGIALQMLGGDGGVAERLRSAETEAHTEVMKLAGVPAAVTVGMVAQIVEQGLASAPPPVPTRRLPKGKRRR